MSVKDFVGQMKQTIEEIKAQGTTTIQCDNLIAYLSEIQKAPEAEPTALQIEKYKADLQNWIETIKRNHEGSLEMFRSVITAGQAAIRTTFLLNGGASVAMLAFIGHLAQFDRPRVPAFAGCLATFANGVLAIAVASGLTYLSQWLYAENSPLAKKSGLVLNLLCMLLGMLSYVFFAWGLFRAYCAFIAYA